MADTAIDKARAQMDAAARTLAEHNLAKLDLARTNLRKIAALSAALKAAAAELCPGSAKDNIGHLVAMIAAVETSVQHETELHRRTLSRAADA